MINKTCYKIPFTQYLLPDGRKKEIEIERPKDIYKKAMSIIEAGYWFEIEVLSTGHINMTISDDEDDYDMEIAINALGVSLAVDKMINHFYNSMKKGGYL